MERPLSALRREARETRETPFGTVGVLHASDDLKAWWIWKEEEDLDPAWKINTHDDFLFVAQGTLKLELRDLESLVLETGDSYVIPAGVAFRGYRWPRDGEPCLFVAVSPGRQMTSDELE